MTLPAVAIGLAVAGGAAHGAFHRNSPVFGAALSELPGTASNVALTFDDGPNPEATPRILDELDSHGVKATFFVLGSHAERWPELVERVVREGHQVGNHGFFHRKLHFRSPSYVRRDIQLGTEAIQNACGEAPRLFRAPHGFRSPWVNSIARSFGQRTVGWSLGVWDSDRPGVEAIVEKTVSGARRGSIILLHDGDGYDAAGDRTQTAAALPGIIIRLRERGFGFDTLPVA
ncbi:MAG TPA: polysaccharide deacetylase family protein [Gemmatimonadaceae bacterium]|jgi:peptidoglycan/xylan/chitin deacetylase (PgdA/CDA1 family)